MTLTLQREQTGDQTDDQTSDRAADRVGVRVSDETDFDNTADKVLKNLPPRDHKNAEYIIKKLSKSDGGWNSKGGFVYRGEAVKGSHMIDLFKHLSLPCKKKSQAPPPMGWSTFLNTLSELNILLSSVSNPQARNEYRLLKTDTEALQNIEFDTPQDTPRPERRKKKKKKNLLCLTLRLDYVKQ